MNFLPAALSVTSRNNRRVNNLCRIAALAVISAVCFQADADEILLRPLYDWSNTNVQITPREINHTNLNEYNTDFYWEKDGAAHISRAVVEGDMYLYWWEGRNRNTAFRLGGGEGLPGSITFYADPEDKDIVSAGNWNVTRVEVLVKNIAQTDAPVLYVNDHALEYPVDGEFHTLGVDFTGEECQTDHVTLAVKEGYPAGFDDVRIFVTKTVPTSVREIDTENAEVAGEAEYFNLQGVRITREQALKGFPVIERKGETGKVLILK